MNNPEVFDRSLKELTIYINSQYGISNTKFIGTQIVTKFKVLSLENKKYKILRFRDYKYYI